MRDSFIVNGVIHRSENLCMSVCRIEALVCKAQVTTSGFGELSFCILNRWDLDSLLAVLSG